MGAEGSSLSVSQQIGLWKHQNPSVPGPAALAGWNCSMLRAQRATCLPHWKVMVVLESRVGNVKGAIMMVKITNDYMVGCGGLRTLYLGGGG